MEAIPLFVKKARFIFERLWALTNLCWLINSPMNKIEAIQNKVELLK